MYRMRDRLVAGHGHTWFEHMFVCMQEEGCYLTNLPDGSKK